MVHAINLDHSIREISYTFFLDNFNMHVLKIKGPYAILFIWLYGPLRKNFVTINICITKWV